MFDIVLSLTQILMLTLIASWLTTGVRDNILYPAQNETFTTEVLTMARLKADYPESYELIAHRAIRDRATQLLLFRVAVVAESIVTLVLWVGVVLMGLALIGVVSPDLARAVAVLGTAGFIAIWAGFLIIGNHFAYWFGHEGAQNTHFQMTLWGTGVLIFLTVG